jgi:hypothetical protein
MKVRLTEIEPRGGVESLGLWGRQPRGAEPALFILWGRNIWRRGVADVSNRKEGAPVAEADRGAAPPGRAAESRRVVERGHRAAPRRNAADARQALRPGAAGRLGPATGVVAISAVEGRGSRKRLRDAATAPPDGPQRPNLAATFFTESQFCAWSSKLESLGMYFRLGRPYIRGDRPAAGCGAVPEPAICETQELPGDDGRAARVARRFCRVQEALTMIGISDFPPRLTAPRQEARR